METPFARGPRSLKFLLLLTVSVPALAVSWGFDHGQSVFVLYREPKLITITILGWTLLSAWLWRFRNEISSAEIRNAIELRPMALLGVFLGYLATTGLWVRVPQNFWYELNQYLLLFALLLVLIVWSEHDPSVVETVRTGLVASLAVVTAVGLIQAVSPLSWLPPIEPQIGATPPSFMGYKNPAALAVLGQIFLLAGLVSDNTATGKNRRIRHFVLGPLLAAELVYLASLGSRTSIAALLVGLFFLLGLGWARTPTLRRAVLGLAITGTVVVVIGATLMVGHDNRRRVASMASMLTSPSSYLESDRGTYFLNTLNMVRHHPMGVGLGDWQTHYPVNRLHDPARSFSPDFQVRRAHSDHVQFLGEAGWPGLVLWVAFLINIVWAPAREYLATGHRDPLFVSAQIVAFAAAMSTDYVIELPYGKAQFFLVVFLAIRTIRSESQRSAPGRSFALLIVATATTILALGQIALHVSLTHKIHLAAHLERTYAADLQAPRRPGISSEPAPFSRSYALGTRFASTRGHTKTFHKDLLILAHSASMLDRSDVAEVAARESLALHPAFPPAYRLMSRLEDRPDAAQRWLLAYENLMRGPTDGTIDPSVHELLDSLP